MANRSVYDFELRGDNLTLSGVKSEDWPVDVANAFGQTLNDYLILAGNARTVMSTF